MVCPKCGATLPDGSASCPYCGEVFSAPQAAPQGNPNPIKEGRPQPRIENTGKDHTAEFDPADRENNKVLGLVCYMGLYFLIPLLTVKKSKFVKFHANQGLAILIGYLAIQVINFIVSILLGVIGAAVASGGVVSGSEAVATVGFGITSILSVIWAIIYFVAFLFLFVLFYFLHLHSTNLA